MAAAPHCVQLTQTVSLLYSTDSNHDLSSQCAHTEGMTKGCLSEALMDTDVQHEWRVVFSCLKVKKCRQMTQFRRQLMTRTTQVENHGHDPCITLWEIN